MVKLVLGLGNPGREYEHTRHNLGYRLIDLLAKRKKVVLKPGKGEYMYADIELNDKRVWLAKLNTFMNLSGWATLDCLGDLGVSTHELLVLCDDVNMPLGKLRIREKGTDGGHKGLRSIIYQLNTLDFPRLRMGVGSPSGEVDLEEYVLEDFCEEEKKAVDKMLQISAEAVEYIILYGLKKGMNRYNSEVID